MSGVGGVAGHGAAGRQRLVVGMGVHQQQPAAMIRRGAAASRRSGVRGGRPARSAWRTRRGRIGHCAGRPRLAGRSQLGVTRRSLCATERRSRGTGRRRPHRQHRALPREVARHPVLPASRPPARAAGTPRCTGAGRRRRVPGASSSGCGTGTRSAGAPGSVRRRSARCARGPAPAAGPGSGSPRSAPGCRGGAGARTASSRSAVSTIPPRYITATRSADVPHHRQVVGDEQVRQPEPLLQLARAG